MTATLPEGWALQQHGLAKGAMMLLGLPHHHDGEDIVVSAGWESFLEAFGYSSERKAPLRQKNASKVASDRLASLRKAKLVLDEERARKGELEKERATIRIAAETGARQRGLGIAETDRVGRDAAASVPDEGPSEPAAYLAAQRLEDEHAIEGIMVIVRQLSDLRWEHSAPVRVPEQPSARKALFEKNVACINRATMQNCRATGLCGLPMQRKMSTIYLWRLWKV